MNTDESPPPYEEVPQRFLSNEWPREAFPPIQRQPSAPAWEVHNSVAPLPTGNSSVMDPATTTSTETTTNAKCTCACFCVTCKWEPCKCHGELRCFNCLAFLGYSLFCLPPVYCCKCVKMACPNHYSECPNRTWGLHEDRMTSGASR